MSSVRVLVVDDDPLVRAALAMVLGGSGDCVLVGEATESTRADIETMLKAGSAAQPAWDALGGQERGRLLDGVADLFEQHREEFYSLCIREAGASVRRWKPPPRPRP